MKSVSFEKPVCCDSSSAIVGELVMHGVPRGVLLNTLSNYCKDFEREVDLCKIVKNYRIPYYQTHFKTTWQTPVLCYSWPLSFAFLWPLRRPALLLWQR
ncbi:hypothetical protein RRG08_011489 [Elysia crispata]|uniref:Uncharacterized protein n=1 Tax=Elysia crispata TaxID=231223 RepID=A0AAE1BAG4_9GAST|nr:hypothetical protein RRG08_011489 [Elysia crispata]